MQNFEALLPKAGTRPLNADQVGSETHDRSYSLNLKVAAQSTNRGAKQLLTQLPQQGFEEEPQSQKHAPAVDASTPTGCQELHSCATPSALYTSGIDGIPAQLNVSDLHLRGSAHDTITQRSKFGHKRPSGEFQRNIQQLGSSPLLSPAEISSSPFSNVFRGVKRMFRSFSIVPKDQEAILKRSDCRYPPTSGLPFPEGNIPGAVLESWIRDKHRSSEKDQACSEDNPKLASQPQTFGSSPSSSTAQPLTPHLSSRLQCTINTDADSPIEGWTSSPSPQTRSHITPLPPDSTASSSQSNTDGEEMETDVPNALENNGSSYGTHSVLVIGSSGITMSDPTTPCIVARQSGDQQNSPRSLAAGKPRDWKPSTITEQPVVSLHQGSKLDRCNQVNTAKSSQVEESSSGAVDRSTAAENEVTQESHRLVSISATTALVPCTQGVYDGKTLRGVAIQQKNTASLASDEATNRHMATEVPTASLAQVEGQFLNRSALLERLGTLEGRNRDDPMQGLLTGSPNGLQGSKRAADVTLSPVAPPRKINRLQLSQLENISQDPAIYAVNSKADFIAKLHGSCEYDDKPAQNAVITPSRHQETGPAKVSRSKRSPLSLYNAFRNEYPDYEGDPSAFKRLCLNIYGIRHRLLESRWDDFVWKFTKEGYTPDVMRHVLQGLEHPSYEQYYHRLDTPIHCSSQVITLESLCSYLGERIAESGRSGESEDPPKNDEASPEEAVRKNEGNNGPKEAPIAREPMNPARHNPGRANAFSGASHLHVGSVNTRKSAGRRSRGGRTIWDA